MEKRKLLDMSLGNPLHPFRSVARYAFHQAAQDLHQYRFMNRGNSDPEIRPVFEAISDYFTARGIVPPDWSGLPLSHFSLMGGGTTEGYNLVIQLLIQDVIAENKRLNRDIKPALLMPVPTYGFFMHAPESWGIQIIPVPRQMESGGHVARHDIITAIKKAHDDGLRVIAYFDSNPNNPLGTIRGKAETQELADIFLALSAHYKRNDEKELQLWQDTQPAIKTDILDGLSLKPGQIWNGPASRVRIIDDMVYDGLEYGTRKAFAFAQIPELYKDTFTLAGPSKAGLANVRGGIVIANSEDIGQLERLRINNNYFPSRATLAALEAFYSMKEPFAAARTRHLARLNRDHRFRGLFMKALINGLDSVGEITATDRSKIIKTYSDLTTCSSEAAGQELKRGIKGVKVITTPEAGFFHLIDFSALRGASYQSPRHGFDYIKKLEDDYSLIDILGSSQSISSCNASWMGLPRDTLISRATFALPLKDILEYTRRLRRAVKTLTPSPVNSRCCSAKEPGPAL